MLDQLIDRRVRIVEQRQARSDNLGEVVRRNIGRHADGDTGRAVDQQVRNPRRQYRRLELLAVVVGREIDSFLVDVGQHLGGDLLQPAFGVAVCRRRVAVDRAEVALAVDQRIAQRKILHHPDQRLVGGAVAVRMIFAEHVTDDARAFDVGPVPDGVRFVHREQHAAVHRFQAVAHIRQCPSDDHAHCVIEVGMPHFCFEAYRQGFFSELLHRGPALYLSKWLQSADRK